MPDTTLDLLHDLNLTNEQIANRVIDTIVHRLLDSAEFDIDHDSGQLTSSLVSTPLGCRLEERIRDVLDERFDRLAETVIAPQVEELLMQYTWQPTNKYGEPRGETETLTEYLTRRADLWMREPVNHEGKSKRGESYNWRQSSTRLEWMIDRHLRYHMERVVENVLKDAHDVLGEELAKAVRRSIDECVDKVRVAIKTKG